MGRAEPTGRSPLFRIGDRVEATARARLDSRPNGASRLGVPRAAATPGRLRRLAPEHAHLGSVHVARVYRNRPLYPNGDAAAHGNVPKLLLKSSFALPG